MVDPKTLVIGGWDICNHTIAQAMGKARVLEYDLQTKLAPLLASQIPLPAPYYSDFIALNQSDRANNTLSGSKLDHLTQIRKDIRDFKEKNQLECVIVVWSANTERFAEISSHNMTWEALEKSINDGYVNFITGLGFNFLQRLYRNILAYTIDTITIENFNNRHTEVSPSTIFAVAAILESCSFINGSPQNTLVPGVVDLATIKDIFIGGDDFKSGQTKMKSVLVDFLVGAGIKPLAITSYNHLGNNDGKNLSEPMQFRAKEIRYHPINLLAKQMWLTI